jgi:hypothetical protein
VFNVQGIKFCQRSEFGGIDTFRARSHAIGMKVSQLLILGYGATMDCKVCLKVDGFFNYFSGEH